jgi:hypothetical protein
MEKAEIKHIIKEQQELTRELKIHYRTLQSEILKYIADHLPEMEKSELKIVIALYLEGRSLTALELQDLTGLHSNTVNNNLFSEHVLAVNELILDEMLSDEPAQNNTLIV